MPPAPGPVRTPPCIAARHPLPRCQPVPGHCQPPPMSVSPALRVLSAALWVCVRCTLGWCEIPSGRCEMPSGSVRIALWVGVRCHRVGVRCSLGRCEMPSGWCKLHSGSVRDALRGHANRPLHSCNPLIFPILTPIKPSVLHSRPTVISSSHGFPRALPLPALRGIKNLAPRPENRHPTPTSPPGHRPPRR